MQMALITNNTAAMFFVYSIESDIMWTSDKYNVKDPLSFGFNVVIIRIYTLFVSR